MSGFERSLLMDSTLLTLEYGLCRAHVVELVIDAHDHHMFRGRIFRCFQRNFEIVILAHRIRELADRLDVLPVSSVNRVLRAFDRRKSIVRTESDMNLRSFQ